jgi:hypothetical protein
MMDESQTIGPTRAGAAPIAWWQSISRSEPRRALTLDRTDMLGAGLRAPRHRCVRPTPFQRSARFRSADRLPPRDRSGACARWAYASVGVSKSRVAACFAASRPRYPGLSRFERRSPADVRYAHRRIGPTRAGAAPIAWGCAESVIGSAGISGKGSGPHATVSRGPKPGT